MSAATPPAHVTGDEVEGVCIAEACGEVDVASCCAAYDACASARLSKSA